MNHLFVQAERIVDPREGKLQVISNIDVCIKISEFLETTLGPYGMDKLFAGSNLIVTNDGATILKHMNITHPVGRLLAELAESQDNEVGDGTTSVVILTAEILNCLKPLVKDNFDFLSIKECLNELKLLSVKFLDTLKIDLTEEILYKLAQTCVTSKNIRGEREHFAKMIVEAVNHADNNDNNSIGIKKIQGGSISDSTVVKGVAFEKSFTYAGYEQQPKKIENPKVLCLNVELEWKSERDNAEIRIKNADDYQQVVDAEWTIITRKLDEIIATGANVVLSSLPIGDYATQYFAKNNIFCAGRVSNDDLHRVSQSCNAKILSSTDFLEDCLGTCKLFEERQLGKVRFNIFEGGDQKTCTMILRGPGNEVIEEVARAVHDGICAVRTALNHRLVVTGGGSTEMELSKLARNLSLEYKNKKLFVARAIAQAFEKIPSLLAKNFGMDPITIIQQLRKEHAAGNTYKGVGLKGVEDMSENEIYEPLDVKKNMVKAAFNAVIAIIMIDSTIVVDKKQ